MKKASAKQQGRRRAAYRYGQSIAKDSLNALMQAYDGRPRNKADDVLEGKWERVVKRIVVAAEDRQTITTACLDYVIEKQDEAFFAGIAIGQRLGKVTP